MKAGFKVKICGIAEPESACAAVRAGADFLGFIFAAASPRAVSPAKAIEIKHVAASAGDVRFAGVFAARTLDEILEIADALSLDVVQLHSAAYGPREIAALRAAGREVWLLDSPDALPRCRAAAVYPDAFLVDGAKGGRTGGTGCLADWRRVAALKAEGSRVVLAGGISPENFTDALATGADVLDLNSSLEISPGVKSPARLAELAEILRRCR